ncbi:ABC transporter ATP-binding protein/permease [Glycomyces sp. L485]|uniref:ABC transporter transmembrane domain-containing protein n=1 Tax=Glycomyces sp. L485 TaxID=2909235 RepID=UPI001F4AF6B2|nr:ABC transporter ATP-binding protein [Glycomyces sp. L485]MCH7230867.1 ABC transporter ATP-binding protein/permease [Glycomyces sp. L485]
MPTAPPGTPLRLITGPIRSQIFRIALGALFFVGAAAASIAQPWLIGKLVDDAIVPRQAGSFALWIGVMLVLAAVHPALWISGYRQFYLADATARTGFVVTMAEHLNDAGPGVRGKVSTGEMINLTTDDAFHAGRTCGSIGHITNHLSMFGIGAVLVWTVSPLLGAVVVGGGIVTGFIAGPMLGRLQQRQLDYRVGLGGLTMRAADIVGGLRVLRGIGGDVLFAERYREQSAELRRIGYRVAGSNSWIYGLRQALPVTFLAGVTWVGALQALAGDISVGGLATAFAVSTMFVVVSGNLINSSIMLVQTWVAAKRIVAFLATRDDIDTGGDRRGATGELHDPDSGLAVEPGRLTVLVSAESAPAQAACERLARYRDSDARWGEFELSGLELDEVRRRVMLLSDEDYLFSGTLARTLRVDGDEALAAIETACAGDVYSSLGSSLDGEVAEGGRNLSGGQRQRLRLARAVAARPETLLAVEPTSAVDAHTESLIAARVAVAREGRTTLVATTSPLWLAHAERVAWMVDGKVHASGAHAELAADADYRRLTSHQEFA